MTTAYFSHIIPIEQRFWRQLDLDGCARLVAGRGLPKVVFYRQLAAELRSKQNAPVSAGQLALYGTLLTFYRFLIDTTAAGHRDLLVRAAAGSGHGLAAPEAVKAFNSFITHFPPVEPSSPDRYVLIPGNRTQAHILLREMLLLSIAGENKALDPFRALFDDSALHAATPGYGVLKQSLHSMLEQEGGLPGIAPSLLHALRKPFLQHPESLSAQLEVVRSVFGPMLPQPLLEQIDSVFGTLKEEERLWGGGGGDAPLPPVMAFGPAGNAYQGGRDGASVFGGYDYPEHEAFSADADWMPNVVLLAKMVYVWLDQLSRQHGYPITRLDQIPESELATLARRGFTGLWLIGVWERSPASQRIKELCGNPDAIASAYSLYDYEIAADLGGWEALANLRQRALHHGIRLASDMVPNHTGIYSRWVLQHPDWFVQTDYPPFPTYRFTGENLSRSDSAVIQVEDGYWTRTDAAVVFRMIEHSTGRTRYIYHGNDGTTIPWNDTAQLNYLLPEVREAVIQTILHVARNFPIIRFDAAMTLAKKHYQRLWYPIPGLGGGIPSRAEHGMNRDEFDALFPVEFWREVVDRVAQEAPGTLLLAEAFWLMEGYFVRTLGMHRVYNSAFMNMLMKEENGKYRQTIKNVLAFNPEVLQRFVNFMNNPDEKTAVEQFGSEGKYFGSCLLLSTMPGLPMFGHGQVEGFREKYGMEYKRAYWNEPVDSGLVQGHEQWIFPILRKRSIFSGAAHFALYDFVTASGVDDNVFAYSNRSGEERALVLYHNSYAKTAGWIRQSSPIAVTGGDNPELATVTIAGALALEADSLLYYAFHDHTRNCDYLRSSNELASQGLYAELGEYEFHIFSNFRPLRDESDEPVGWGALCSALNGKGVENLDDELKQLRYARLNCAFADLLTVADDLSDERFPDAVALFHKELSLCQTKQKRAVSTGLTAGQLVVLLGRIDSVAAPYGGTGYGAVLTSADSRRLLLTLLLLQPEPAGTVSRYGLDCTLKRILETRDRRSAALLNALIAVFPAGAKQKKTPIKLSALIENVFCNADSRLFVDVHTSNGVAWFHKESYEELLFWCGAVLLLHTTPRRAVAERLANERQALCQLAQHAGYRVELLHELVAMWVESGIQPKKTAVKTPRGIPRGKRK